MTCFDTMTMNADHSINKRGENSSEQSIARPDFNSFNQLRSSLSLTLSIQRPRRLLGLVTAKGLRVLLPLDLNLSMDHK